MSSRTASGARVFGAPFAPAFGANGVSARVAVRDLAFWRRVETLQGHNNLAHLLQSTNRLAEDEPLMRRALEIFTESLDSDHPSTRTVRHNYDLPLQAIKAGE
jgi:hypothetical protein